MTVKEQRTTYLNDYTPPAHLTDEVDLRIDLGEETTTVTARLALRRNPVDPGAPGPLVLFGRDLALKSLCLDGRPLSGREYRIDGEELIIFQVPERFGLEVTTEIRPRENTALEGLYLSGGNFCTQCEAEGFRKITYYPDRPDVLARFTTTLTADRDKYPVLLANGNLTAQGELEGGRHYACWEDPFPKPSYLFALVAGRLVRIEDVFRTRSGREVALRIFVEERNRDKCDHAMRSLKEAMRWEEEVFGLEYDLDVYMVVAVDDFNMGAMENKGLNIFNSKYVLARPETATDSDFQAIEGVIGHEYFHNWTGNRITCRDWFQLSLKEGLTVFRDQEFSADMTSRPVRRIEEVRLLRNTQFPEDAGPTAHPVRPDSYVEINNFYTATVYNKGAEVIRMLHTLLGREGFRKGMDLYVARHDGQAVTVDDFLRAMADATGADLDQFARWYSQAGTPQLEVEQVWDEAARTCTLTVRQACPPTPGQERKAPFHIPLAIGLLDREGRDLPLQLDGETAPAGGPTRVLSLRRETESFRFVNLPHRPLPSLLRGFSAPLRLRFDYSEEDLAFLMARDSDEFNRWEAGQQLAVRIMLRCIEDFRQGRPLVLAESFVGAFRRTLLDPAADRAFLALALTLPSEVYLAEQMAVVDPGAIHAVREFFRRRLAEMLQEELLSVYRSHREEGPYTVEPAAVGRRSLKNLCLSYLMTLETAAMAELCLEQLRAGHNMTDVLAALGALAHSGRSERGPALEAFCRQWREEPLVIDKWFTLQATTPRPEALEEVLGLMSHPAFNIGNPNRIRALIGAFGHHNQAAFHRPDGAGYRFLADQVLALDRLNPQVAARLVGVFSRWRRFDEGRRALMRTQLERIAAAEGLSRDVGEIVGKSLA